MVRLKQRDPAAFESLLRDQTGKMLAVARSILAHEEDARDAVQEAMLSVFQKIDSFQGDAKLTTWVHRIVINASLLKMRVRRRLKELSISQLLPQYLEDGHRQDPGPPWRGGAGSGPDSPAALVADDESRLLVREQIAQLPADFRDVIVLRDIQEVSTQEAAGALGISPAAVKTRLHRARQALRELLDPHMRLDTES